jgi:hypothetical protein
MVYRGYLMSSARLGKPARSQQSWLPVAVARRPG